jgi:hypothetical protein
MSGIKVNGEWRTPGLVHAKVDNTWRIGATTHAKVDGVWRITTFGAPPPKPQVSYFTTGTFAINYNPTLVYEAIRVSGGGSASFNATNGTYFLSDVNSAYNIVARYAVGAPASDPGYMERKAYGFSCRDITGTCCDRCCVEQCSCGCLPPGPNGCPEGSSPNGQCGCGTTLPDLPCMFGCVGCIREEDCNCRSCVTGTICDVLINEPGYTNSGTEWYKIG